MWWAAIASVAWGQQWWNLDWTGRAQIRFSNEGREALDDFPVLVTLEHEENFDYDVVGPGGADLRFVDDDGTLLSYDIDTWDDEGRSQIWVRVPRIEADSNTDRIWMYFGNAQAPAGEDEAGTWSPAYTAVWHLDETLADATVPSESALSEFTEDTDGIVGAAREFDGNDDQLTVAEESPFDYVDGFTISAWFRTSSWVHSSYDAILTKGDVTWQLHRCWLYDRVAFTSTIGGSTHELCSTADVDDGQWHHVVGVYDSVQGYQALYLDGVEQLRVPRSGIPYTNDDPLWIGNNQDFPERSFSGDIDEVRAQSIPRSPDWIAAEHATVRGTFLSWCSRWVGGDADGDGVCDDEDLCAGNDGLDFDLDGLPDDCDPCREDPLPDTDGDGLCDSTDPCPSDALAVDQDGDGAWSCTDCDDGDDRIFPEALDVPGNGIDEDCQGGDAQVSLPDPVDPDLKDEPAPGSVGCACSSSRGGAGSGPGALAGLLGGLLALLWRGRGGRLGGLGL